MHPVLKGSAPWAVILCRYSDVGIPDIARNRFFEMVTEFGNGGLFDYWQDNSHGNVSTAGSAVFGWYTMHYSFVNDSADPLHNAADTTTPRRGVWIKEARRLAEADGVDLSAYHGVIAVLNAAGDGSNLGTDMVMNVSGRWGQSDWRWCRKCQGLAFGGSDGPGLCQAGGRHDHSGSLNYAIAMNDTSYPGQENWRWCRKCQGLCFGGSATPGACSAGGDHDVNGSGNYRLSTAERSGHVGQNEWKWCKKCQGLSYAGYPSPGMCAAGNNHDYSSSGDYLLAYVDSNLDLTYAAHETGHGYGLEHSWSANPDTEYGDPWDIMSAMNVRRFATRDYVNCGPALNAPTRYLFGWLPDNRIVSFRPSSSNTRKNSTVTLNSLDRIDSDGPLMARIVAADRVFTIEYRRPIGWDRGIQSDAVLIHELRSHYTAGQVNWRWCDKCQGLFFAGTAACAAGGLHDHTNSGHYILNNSGRGEGQSDWRWCNKCQQLTFVGAGSAGICAAGGTHDHGGSDTYRIAGNGTDQSGWKWCRKCQALAYAGAARPGTCQAGGNHDHTGSGDYSLPKTEDAPGQPGWMSCRKCQGISFTRFAPCAAGGAHRWWTGSGDYGVSFSSVKVKNGQAGWRWCKKCSQLNFIDGGSAGVCSGGGTHDHSDSGDYTLATAASGMSGQSNWRWCKKCQVLAYGGSAGSCAASGQHDLSESEDYVIANLKADLVYLVGAARYAGDIFEDNSRRVRIAVKKIDSAAGTAVIEIGYQRTRR
jgi:hypothetical protein